MIWGKEKGDWIEWYNDIKNLMNKLGYEHTHIGILSKNYSSGKILTVARKAREILTKINEGEIPMSFSCYSLPKGFKVATFDYNFLCERNDSYMSVIIKEMPLLYAETKDKNNLNTYNLIKNIEK